MSKLFGVCFSTLLFAGLANAQDASAGRTTLYLGGGTADTTNPLKNDGTPFSIGIMHQPADKSLIFGFDIGGEGTSIDSTYLQNKNLSQAISYNFLIGTNVIDNGNFKADASLLVGIRESAADCPNSYLGYACYANTSPIVEYKGNFGAVVTLSFNKVAVGFRATEESAQFLIGARF